MAMINYVAASSNTENGQRRTVHGQEYLRDLEVTAQEEQDETNVEASTPQIANLLPVRRPALFTLDYAVHREGSPRSRD